MARSAEQRLDAERELSEMSSDRLEELKKAVGTEEALNTLIESRLKKEKQSAESAEKRLGILQQEIAGLKKLEAELTAGDVQREARRQQAEAALEAQRTAISLAKQLAAQNYSQEEITEHINGLMGTQNLLGHDNLENLLKSGTAIKEVQTASRSVASEMSKLSTVNLGKGFTLALPPMASLRKLGTEWAGAIAQGEGAMTLFTMKAGKSLDQLSNKALGLFSQLKTVTVSLAKSIDAQTKAFEAQFRLGSGYTDMIVSQYTEMNELGVSLEEATKAQAVLTQVVTEYTQVTAAEREELSRMALVAGELGVSMESYGSAVQATMKIQGQSTSAAITTMGELSATAKALSLDQEKFAADYAASAGALAKFGGDAVNSFKELQRTAKITGMEMNKILNLTNKFDTFEDAAGMAGKLNAALGGNFVNAMDMMMDTDPVSRFESVRNAILDSGLSFDTMSYYQKQFYTDSLGLGDVGDLALLLSGNMKDLAGTTQLSAAQWEEQKEQAKALVTLQEKLDLIFTQNAESIEHLVRGAMNFVSGLLAMKGALYGVIGAAVVWKAVLAAATLQSIRSQKAVAEAARTYLESASAAATNVAPLEALNAATGRLSRTVGSEAAMQRRSAGAHNLQAGAVRGNTVAVEQKLAAITAENQALRAEITTLQGNAAAHLEGAGATQAGAAATQAGTVATGNHTVAQATDTAATELNTVATTRSLKTDVLKIASSFRLAAANKAAAMAQGIETAATNGGVIAKGAMIVASGFATAANYAFGTSLTVATGGLILIIPAIIALVVGIVALVKKFGAAKVAGGALLAGLVLFTGPIGLIIGAIVGVGLAITALIKNWDRVWETIKEFPAKMGKMWDSVLAGIKAGGMAILRFLAAPFIGAAEIITDVFSYFAGQSTSPFMDSIITGVVSGASAILSFITAPFEKAAALITQVFDAISVEKSVAFGMFMGTLIAATPFLGATAVALGAMAVGVSLLAVGLQSLQEGKDAPLVIDALAGSFERLFAAVPVGDFVKFTQTLVVFGGTLAVLGYMAPVLAVGIAALGAGMLVFAGSLTLMKPGLVALTHFVDSMSLLTESVDELMGVADAFEHIAEAIDQIPTTKAVALSVLTTAMEGAAVSLAAAGPAAVAENIQNTIRTTKEVLLGGGAGTTTTAAGGVPQNATFNGTLQLDAEATRRFLQGEAEVVVGKIGLAALHGG